MTLNKDKPHSIIGGKLPLRYLQNGRGFNNAGEFIGWFNEVGDPVDAPVEPAPVVAPVEVTITAPAGDGEVVDAADDERARNDDGTYRADDPATPEVNEAYVSGKRRGRKPKSAD